MSPCFNLEKNKCSKPVPNYKDLVRTLYSVLLLALFLVWFLVQPSMVLGSLTTGNNTFSYRIVEVDLSSLGINSSNNIIVTVLNGSSESELPFTIKPVGVDTIKYVSDTLYRNRSIYNMSYEEHEEFIRKFIRGEINRKYVSSKITEIHYLVRNSRSDKILVFIPGNVRSPINIEEYKGWYPYALRSNLTSRAVYVYDKYVLFIYFNSEDRTRIDKLLYLPDDTPNSVLYARILNDKDMLISNYIVDLRTSILLKTHGEARLVRIEKYREMIGKYSEPQYSVLWYLRPWASQHAGKGRIRLGNMMNKHLTGSNTYQLNDQFYIGYNTTRYEVWIWVSSNKHVSGTLLLILNNPGNPIVWNIELEPGILYGFGAIIMTTPEEPGNYLSPGKINTSIVLQVSDSSAKIFLNSVVVAKAYVLSENKYYNGIFVVDRKLYGIGDLLTKNDDPTTQLDERYTMIRNGEAEFTLLLPSNIIPSALYPYIYVTVQSSPDQKYDRIVQLYLDGTLLDEKIAKNPQVPNGTKGVRSCTFYIYGDTITNILVSSMKKGVSPILKIVIKGFQKPQPPNYLVREKWYAWGTLKYYTRATCLLSYISNNNVLFRENPTAKLSPSICDFIAYDLKDVYHGIELTNGFSDVMVRYLHLTIDPVPVGMLTPFGLYVEYNPTSRLVSETDTDAIGFTGITKIDLELYSPVPAYVYYHEAYGPGGEEVKKALESIQWGLWSIGLALSILSVISGNWAVGLGSLLATALSYPGLYVYGVIISSSWEYGSSYRDIKMHIEWNPGWDYYRDAAHITAIFMLKPLSGHVWPVNERFTLYYEYKTVMGFYDRVGSQTYERYGTVSDYGYLVFYSWPPSSSQ